MAARIIPTDWRGIDADPGTIEAEGYDLLNGGQTILTYEKNGEVQFQVRDVPQPDQGE